MRFYAQLLFDNPSKVWPHCTQPCCHLLSSLSLNCPFFFLIWVRAFDSRLFHIQSVTHQIKAVLIHKRLSSRWVRVVKEIVVRRHRFFCSHILSKRKVAVMLCWIFVSSGPHCSVISLSEPHLCKEWSGPFTFLSSNWLCLASIWYQLSHWKCIYYLWRHSSCYPFIA